MQLYDSRPQNLQDMGIIHDWQDMVHFNELQLLLAQTEERKMIGQGFALILLSGT